PPRAARAGVPGVARVRARHQRGRGEPQPGRASRQGAARDRARRPRALPEGGPGRLRAVRQGHRHREDPADPGAPVTPAVRRLVERLSAGLMAAITGVVAFQVLTRYVLQHPAAWPEEVARYLFVWG